MPAKPSAKRMNRSRHFVGSTQAEAPQAHPDRVANPGENSIQAAREERDAKTGYADLVREVEALEARVTDRTNGGLRDDVTRLRNKIERPPLNEDASNGANSVVLQRENVDRVRAIAQALAVQNFGG